MLYDLKIINEQDGTLVPIDFFELPFTPKRVFYVRNVPAGEERGKHAHYKTKQLLICIKGSILVRLHNGKKLVEHLLSDGEAVLINEMIWDSQVFKTGDDVLLSICSTNYDKSDYIEDFEEFLKLTN